MFNSLQVKLVNDKKTAVTTETPDSTAKVDYIASVALESSKEIAKGVAAVIGTYMLADTLRKITVHIIATKIS